MTEENVTLLGDNLVVEKEPYTQNIYNISTNINKENSITEFNCSIEVPRNVIKYIGVLSGSMKMEPDIVNQDIYSSINVVIPKGIIIYVGDIHGILSINANSIEEDDIGFESSIDVPKVMYDQTINGALLINSETCNEYINGTTDINKNNYQGEFDGNFLYAAANLDKDINSTIKVVQAVWNDIDSDVSINAENHDFDLNSKIKVEGISISKELCDGNVTMDQYIEKSRDLWANMRYISMPYDPNDESNVLLGKLSINNWSSRYDINSRIQVPSHRILYTFLSKLKAVRGRNIDIASTINISADHVYDIDATVNLEYHDYENDRLLEGNIHIEPHEWKDINSQVYLDKTDTRRDFNSTMFVVQPVDRDITSTITVKNLYRRYKKNIDSIMRVGNEYAMSFESNMNVEAALQRDIEIPSCMEVINQLMPGRVVFFTDPLWQYEPYVLKNAVSTFLDRIFLTSYLTVVYGGSPRANWDIKHFCGIYRIPPRRQIEVPFDFMPSNPLANKNSMIRFVHTMLRFRPNDTHKQVDKVFVFSNNPYAHNSTYLNPLFEACRRYHIPVTVITSRGELVGTDPTNTERFINHTTVDHNLPLDAQPHWQYGAGTKHRDIFDDRPII